eukprot:3580460-Amphidinium_carterae.1
MLESRLIELDVEVDLMPKLLLMMCWMLKFDVDAMPYVGFDAMLVELVKGARDSVGTHRLPQAHMHAQHCQPQM